MSEDLCIIVGKAYLERKRAKTRLKQIEERAREASSGLEAARRLADRASHDPDPAAEIREYPSAKELHELIAEAFQCLQVIKRCEEELDDA